MGRSMTKRTTLLTIPHSKKGYGSKRAARGKLHFEDGELVDVTVKVQNHQALSKRCGRRMTWRLQNATTTSRLRRKTSLITASWKRHLRHNFSSTPSVRLKTRRFGTESAPLAPHNCFKVPSARTACREGKLIKNLTKNMALKPKCPCSLTLHLKECGVTQFTETLTPASEQWRTLESWRVEE